MSKRENPRPHGKSEVMVAVRTAAAELLAERGPRDISVRDVASRAGVNHALVHRHFGTKDELFRAVIAEESAAVGVALDRRRDNDVPEVRDMLRQLQSRPAYWRILARAVLDAPELLEPGPMSAGSTVLAMVSGPIDPDDATRSAAAVAGSLALGWIVFGEHLTGVLEIADNESVESAVADAIRLVLSRRAS